MKNPYVKINIFVIAALISLLFFPSISPATERASGITDREIVERLTRLEEGQKAMSTQIKQLREDMSTQTKQLREDMNTQFNRMAAIFTALVASIIGFAIWDRRSMIRPFENKVKNIETEIAQNRNKLHSLIETLRELSKTDEKVAKVLKSFHLL